MNKTKIFIDKAIRVHNNFYDYGEVVYSTAKTKVVISCPLHGNFEMTPNNHLSGQGCPKCSNRQKLTTEDFIKRAQDVHGDTFDYSLADYKNMKTKVVVLCKHHGEILITPDSHLRGGGCRKCADAANSANYKYSQKLRMLK